MSHRLGLVLAVVGLVALGVARAYLGGDCFFYLAAGDFVLDHGLPNADPFAYTSKPDRWILHFPLLQVGFAWIERAAGLGVLRVLGGLVAGVGLVALWLARGRTAAERTVLLLPALALAFAEPEHFSVRGQTFGTLYLVGLVVLVERLRRGDRVPGWMPLVLVVLWVNSHPSFVLALVLPAALVVGRALDPVDERAPLAPTVRFLVIGALSIGITPYGFELALDTWTMMAGGGMSRLTDFRPADLHEPAMLAIVLAGPALAAARLSRGAPYARSDAFVLIALACMATLNRRFVSVLLVWSAVPLLAVARAWLGGREVSTKVTAALGLALALLAAASFRTMPGPLSLMPAKAAAFVERTRPPGGVASGYIWGSYLTWRFRGEPRVMIDGRVSTFPNSLLDDYLTLHFARPGWEAVLDIYGVGTLLWRHGDALDAALEASPRWRRVHEDDKAVVWARASGPDARSPSETGLPTP